jgi:hypothetical protein
VWLRRMYFSKPPTDDDDDDEAYLPVHLPSDIGASESIPLPSNDHDDKEATLDGVAEGETTNDVAEGETTNDAANDAATTTRSGRSVRAPAYLNDYEFGNSQYEIKLTKAEERFIHR